MNVPSRICRAATSACAMSVALLAPAAHAADPPVLTRLSTKNDFIAHFDIEMRVGFTVAERYPEECKGLKVYLEGKIPLDSCDYFIPSVDETSWSTPDQSRTSVEMRIDSEICSPTVTPLAQLPGRSRFTRIALPSVSGGDPKKQDFPRSIRASLRTFHRCHETSLDERRAAEIPWHDGDLPDGLQAWLGAEPCIDPANPDVQSAVRNWLGRRPQELPPVMTAKMLAARVIETVQPSGFGTNNNLRYIPMAFSAQPADETLLTGRGSPTDLSVLLVAVWRAAGIPARLVLGFDERITRERGETNFRAWAEFALFDPRDGAVEWIPVDAERQREFSSRPPPLRQPWEYFGNNRFLDDAVPLAFHLLPPEGSLPDPQPALYDMGTMFAFTFDPGPMPVRTPDLARKLQPALYVWAIGAPVTTKQREH